jgi:hypothetical protein
MNEENRKTMAAYGITCVPRNVYYYRDFKYERLEDAIRYAEIDAERHPKTDAG